jgi:hypothetical protein
MNPADRVREAARALLALYDAPWQSVPDMELAVDEAVRTLGAALALPVEPAKPHEVWAADSLVGSVIAWRLASKRNAARLLRGEIDHDEYRSDEANVERLLNKVRIESDALLDAERAAKEPK